MVVLSVGLTPPADVQGLANKFGIELNAHGFCKADSSNPMETTRPGIFVSGTFQGPADIPEKEKDHQSGEEHGDDELLNHVIHQETDKRGVVVGHIELQAGEVLLDLLEHILGEVETLFTLVRTSHG